MEPLTSTQVTKVEARRTYNRLHTNNPWTTELRITFADGSQRGIRYAGKLSQKRAEATAQNTATNYPMCLGLPPVWEGR